jgi:protein-S-isoprenylcysteine O-methyltransferase Ste14
MIVSVMSRGPNSSLLIAPVDEANSPLASGTLNFVSREGDKISGQIISALGLCGFLLAWGICYFVKPISADELFIIYAGLTAAPMVFANVAFNKTHRRLTSGLSCESHPINVRRCLVKLTGLFGTILILFLIYGVLPESGRDFYRPAEQFILWFAAPTVLITVPYFIWIDSRMAVPEDGYWYMGLLMLGRWSMIKWPQLKEHALDWFIKSYFLPFMFAGSLVHLKMLTEKGIDVSSFGYFYGTCLNLIFAVDICFGAIGYLLTMRLLDAQIRTSEPTLLGWISAVMCYAPIGPLIWSNYLNYEGKRDWQDWLIPYPVLYISWAFLILLLLSIYTWSTCSFGCRFSNLTNRGIIVDGPYRYVKHPAYLSKNVAWWLMSVPFVSHATWHEALTACLCLFVTNLIYVVRALTEERHLMRDPAYVVYVKWIQQYGLLAQIFRGLRRGV